MATSHRGNAGEGIMDIYKPNIIALEAISKRIQRNTEGIDDDTIATWKRSFVEIATTYDALKARVEATRAVLESQEYAAKIAQLNAGHNNASVNKKDELFEFLNGQVARECQKTNRNPNTAAGNVRKILKIADRNRRGDDDDFEVVETEETDDMYKCPYSMMLMKEPMKSTKCIHHIDKTSLHEMLKKPNASAGATKCPVAGCRGLWDKTATLDQDFILQMKRYFRLKENSTRTASSSAYNIDEDEGYTDI